MADSIRCPECRAEIPLTEVISHQIEEELAAKLARELAAREQQFEAREQALAEAAAAREQALVDEAAEREAGIRQEYEEAAAVREAELQKRAEEKVATALADLGSRVEDQEAQLRDARERELELLQQKRKLDEEKEKLGLELARRGPSSSAAARA